MADGRKGKEKENQNAALMEKTKKQIRKEKKRRE